MSTWTIEASFILVVSFSSFVIHTSHHVFKPPRSFLLCLHMSPNHGVSEKLCVPQLDQAKNIPNKQPSAVESNLQVYPWLVGPTAWRADTASLRLFLPWRQRVYPVFTKPRRIYCFWDLCLCHVWQKLAHELNWCEDGTDRRSDNSYFHRKPG